uniref:Uncharacterized protein n=1 Tax=Rhizophora mucronata TaxID=61149 RepID=A0A2P2R291_RHIMU
MVFPLHPDDKTPNEVQIVYLLK